MENDLTTSEIIKRAQKQGITLNTCAPKTENSTLVSVKVFGADFIVCLLGEHDTTIRIRVIKTLRDQDYTLSLRQCKDAVCDNDCISGYFTSPQRVAEYVTGMNAALRLANLNAQFVLYNMYETEIEV